MFSWRLLEHIYVNASPKAIWDIWVDVANWPQWYHGLEWSELTGEFKPGAQGRLKPKGWPITTFVITKVDPEFTFHDKSKLPLTTLEFSYTIHRQTQGVIISHQIVAKGLLAPLLRFTMRKKLKKILPQALKTLASIAEKPI